MTYWAYLLDGKVEVPKDRHLTTRRVREIGTLEVDVAIQGSLHQNEN